LAAGAWAGAGAWQDAKLRGRVGGRWTQEAAHADPTAGRVAAEYRPDGTFEVRRPCEDGSAAAVERGRWWVSGGRLVLEYELVDGRPVVGDALAGPHRLLIVRADHELVLVWSTGLTVQFRRAMD
jgi:hypothetical protein